MKKMVDMCSVGRGKWYLLLIFLLLLLSNSLSTCDVNNQCEQNINENLTLFVYNRTDNSLLTGADCYIDIWYPNRTIITNDGLVTEESNGKYYYTISGNETSTQGVHTILWNCTKNSYNSYVSDTYEIVLGLQQDYIYEWNNTYFNNWDTWINATYYNIITPSSTLMQNILSYLDGVLTTTLSELTQIQIAQNTWNTTIVEDREVTGGTGAWKRDPDTGRWYRS